MSVSREAASKMVCIRTAPRADRKRAHLNTLATCTSNSTFEGSIAPVCVELKHKPPRGHTPDEEDAEDTKVALDFRLRTLGVDLRLKLSVL
eukprot:3488219-Amphidinium_carterae.2